MPTYAYACKDCGHSFDTVQSFTEDSLTTCPQCAGRLRKKFGNVGVTFKGSGFYRNDSRSSAGSAASSSENSGSSSLSSSESSSASSSSEGSSGSNSSSTSTTTAASNSS